MSLKPALLRTSVFIALVIVLYGCPPETPDPPPPPPAPAASFTYSSTRNFPVQVNFVNNSASPFPGASVFFWDFGDGATSTIVNPVHIYTTAGTYMVKLVQQYSNGSRDTVLKALSLTPSGPSGVSTTPNSISATDFNFSFTPSFTVFFTNTSTNAVSYQWNFGNGNTSSSAAATVNNVYTGTGPYSVILKAINNAGAADTCSAVINF